MTTAAAAPGRRGWLDVARGPVLFRAWCATAQLVLDLFVGVVGFVLVVVGVALSIGLLPLFLLGVPVGVATLLGAHGLARSRAWPWWPPSPAYASRPAPRCPEPQRTGWGGRLCSSGCGCPGLWKEAAYAVLLLPVGAVGAGLVVGALGRWPGVARDAGARGARGARGGGPRRGAAGRAGRRRGGLPAGRPVGGAWLGGRRRGAGPVAAAPAAGELLAARVVTLEDTRARVVAAADAERQRIERDLHDGAQQRLVALAMRLGRPVKLGDEPEALALLLTRRTTRPSSPGRAARARPRHPPRGADRPRPRAALSALAARCPVPVDARRDGPRGPRRPSRRSPTSSSRRRSRTSPSTPGRAAAVAGPLRRRRRCVVEVRDNGAGGAAGAGQRPERPRRPRRRRRRHPHPD